MIARGLVLLTIALCTTAVASADAPVDLGPQARRVRTPSVRVYAVEGQVIRSDLLMELERAVHEIGRKLDLSEEQLASLRDDPIEYFYLADPALLRRLGALDVDGLAQPSHRRILSVRIPHEHELAHVLAHLAYPDAPEGNAPVLQEGLASYLGGHRALGPLAVLADGQRILDTKRIDLYSLWSRKIWNESRLSGHERYAVSARFVQFLVEARGGIQKLQTLQRLLAGRPEEVSERPASIVVTQLEGIYETSWTDLWREFGAWCDRTPVGGVVASAAPRRAPDFVAMDSQHHMRLWDQGSTWIVAARATDGPLDMELRWSAAPQSNANVSGASRADQRFALALDAEGGRLYDRHRDRMLVQWFKTEALWQSVEDNEVVWEFAAEVIKDCLPIHSPRIWSQPRFEVD